MRKFTKEDFLILERLAASEESRNQLFDRQTVQCAVLMMEKEPARFAQVLETLHGWKNLAQFKGEMKKLRAKVVAGGKKHWAAEKAKSTGRAIIEANAPRRTAENFVAACAPNLKFLGSEWLDYTGTYYASREELHIRSMLWKFMAEGVDSETGEDFEPGKRDVDEVIDALRGIVLTALLRPPTWFNYDPDVDSDPREVIACRNGILHLPTRVLDKHDPGFFTRNALPFDFDAEAPPPLAFLAFLDSIWPEVGVPKDVAAGNRQNKLTLQEMMGHLLTGETKYQRIFLLMGQSRGGKGVLTRLIAKLVGEANVVSQSATKLGKEFGMKALIGKQVLVIPDLRFGRNSNSATIVEMLLSISGEDDVSVGRKFMDDWSGKLNTRIVLASNMELVLPDQSGALHARLIPLVFKKSFADNPDVTLDAKLAAELPSILNWAIDGLERLEGRVDERGFKQGFIIPPDGKVMLAEIGRQGSTVQQFLRERCVLGRDEIVPKEDLFEAFEEWCREVDIDSSYGPGTFAKELRAASGYNIGGTRPREGKERVQCFAGVDLK